MHGRTDVRRRLVATLAGFGALAVLVCLLAPLVGSTSIHLTRVFDRSIPFADNIDATQGRRAMPEMARNPREFQERSFNWAAMLSLIRLNSGAGCAGPG